MTATPATTFQIWLPTLARNAVGEYTARSVAADPLDAAKLRLVKQVDGDYAAPSSHAIAASGIAAGRSSAAVQAALYGFPLGG